ncbi:MAG: DMT family transporter [Lentihominibacter sp.]
MSDISKNGRTVFKGEAMLLIASIIWGSAFIFQKMGMDHIGPMTFTFFRFGIGALCMIPVIAFADRMKGRRSRGSRRESGDESAAVMPFSNKTLIVGGILVGVSNYFAAGLQQFGIVYTTAGKAGFITAMDMVMVPFLLLLLRRKVHGLTWIGVVIAVFGLYLLCMTGGFHMQLGDLLCLGGALGYAVQILLIDCFVEKVDPLKLAFYEFAVTTVLSLVTAVIIEDIDMAPIIDCAVPILYTAVLEVCIAFSLQMMGQRYAPPALATITMSMESVFAAISGALFLGEIMSGREIWGCVIMFCAFIIAQIPEMRGEE